METPSTSKQITIDVPADRVPEFYAFFGRFLAAERRGRGRRGGPHGHRCRPHHDDRPEREPVQEPAA